jgi:hypothetical protein
MKDQILKIAKVKSEKEFYKKYPTEAAFMKAHGKALKKAAMGAKMVDTQLTQLTDFGNPPQAQSGFNFDDALVGAQATNLGMSKNQYMTQQKMMADQANAETIAGKGSDAAGQTIGGLKDIASLFGEGDTDMTKVGDITEIGDAIGRNGLTIEEAQFGKFLKGIGSKVGGFAKTAGKNLMDKKQDNWMSGPRGLFGNTKKASSPIDSPFTTGIFGQGKKSTATFNTKTGMVDNASGSVSKADTDALGLSEGVPSGEGFDWAGAAGSALQAAPDIINGIGQIKEQKAAIKKADQSAQISGLTAQAAESSPVGIQKNKFLRPEDQKFGPNQMSPSYGTGSNVLNAQYGAEIQNTYAPYDLYDDLGYEPLRDSNPKQYAYGGGIPTAEFGDYFQDSGQASIGKGVGSAIGSAFFGPLGGQVGGFLGKVAGNLLGGADDANELARYQDQTQKNVERSAWAQGAKSIQSQYSSNMENGGWVSHDWQPQVIASFGDHRMKNLLAPPNDADMLRSGGHFGQVLYTPPSAEAMFTGRAQNGSVLDSDIRSKMDMQSITDNGRYNENLRSAISSTDRYADGRPVEKTDMYSMTRGQGDNQRVKEFLRSQTGDGAPQYSMQKTYKPLFSDQYKTVSREIGAGRGERRMADMENFLAKDKMEYGGQMAYGGDLQTLWGGKLNTVSHNEYLGDSVEAEGNSHQKSNGKGQTGIGVQYGDNVVEVENEPIQKFNNGGQSDDVVVYGDIHIPNYVAKDAGDEKLEGVKFKKAVFGLNKEEIKLNKIQQKASDLALISDDGSIGGQLGMNSALANNFGADLGKKIIADKKKKLAAGQNAILDTANEYGYEDPKKFSEDVLKGNLKLKKDNVNSNQAKYGAAIEKAQPGFHMDFEEEDPFAPTQDPTNAPAAPGLPTVDEDKYAMIKELYAKAEKTKKGTDVKKFQQEYHKLFPEYAKAVIGKEPLTAYAKKNKYKLNDLRGNEDSIFGKRTKQYMAALDNASKTPKTIIPPPPRKVVPPDETPNPIVPSSIPIVPPKQKFPWESIINEGLNYLRPYTKNPFDYRQTLGEQYALANNQLEPVQAQLYNPMLDTPYDVSFQDQLNANQSDFNAMLRQAGNNPEAMAALAAQKYGANSSVLANQFRANQQLKNAVYSKNRDIMNDAQLKNLQLLDQQYVRQAQAKSNTKAQAVTALNSISAKMLQNELDTKQLNVYENLYNYRFGKGMRARNLNGLANINMPTVYNPDTEDAQTVPDTGVKLPTWDDYTKFVEQSKAAKKSKTTKTTAMNGAIVKALKNL